MERSIPYALLDNIIGFRDDHETPGEKLGKALGEDPLGVATTVVKGVGKLAKSAFDRVIEEGPLDALTGSVSEYAESLIGSGKRLTSGTQEYIDSGMTQAAARDAQISDALRLSEIFPLMSTAAYSARLGRVAVPDAPFDASRRGFLGGIAALPAVAAIAPDALTGVLKSVGPKVARAASSLDLSVAKINALIKQKELLAQPVEKIRRAGAQYGNQPDSEAVNSALRKRADAIDIEARTIQDEIEQASRKALDDLKPADFANAADDSIETIAEQFSNSRILESEMDSPAFDALMEQVKIRGMNNAKDARGIDQFPYARNIFEDYFNPINAGDVKIPPSMFNPRGPQSLNMVRPVATDIKKGMTELNVLEINKRMQLREEKMIAEGNSASEIDAMKAELRKELYKVQGLPSDIEDFYADGGEVMNGIGSLSETARNMNRGPRGLAGYMADGGPVYMKNGGGSSEANARKDILSTIYEIESNSNYDQWNLKAKNPPEAPLSSLTIQEIMDFQGDENGPAAGAGQIKYNTLKYLIKSGVLSPDDVFSPENQDAANSRLLDRRGFVSWFNGDISTEEFGSDVAKEWASLPLLESRAVLGKNKARGDSRYGGSNKALVGADYWQEALDSAKVSQPTMVASADTSGIETFLPQMEAQATPTQPDFYDPTFQGLQMRTPEASSMPGPLEPERPPVEEEKQYASLYEKYAPQAMQDALQGIGYFNSPTGPSGYQNFADGGEASVVRLGGYSKKSAPRPVNAPVGRQSMSLTREDQGLLVDFLPIAGDIKGGVEGAEFISEEFKRENPNYLLMGIVGGAAVLGVIPFAGDAAQKMIMRGARNFRKNRVTEETLEMLSEQDANIVQDLTDKTPVSELTESQRLADEIASDLRAGNIDSVTDDRLELLDVQGDIRLRQHYIDGNVGTDADGVTITLDTTARMDRARSQGYDPDSPIYHGSNSEIRTADPDKGKYRSSNTGLFTTDVPDVADAYIRRVVREEGFNQDLDGRMYPLLARNTDQGWDVDVQGGNWNNITRDTPALNRRTNAPGQTAYDAFPELFDRKMPPDRPPDVRSTNDLAREARLAGDARINFLNMSDRGGQYKRWDGETHEAANLREKTAGLPSNVRVDFEGSNLRAPTAIFDQRLTHLKNIGMADGGEIMNGIGSLNETARNMSRGPRGIAGYQRLASGGEALGPPPLRGPDPQGIGAYQRFADGGPVYMAEGGLTPSNQLIDPRALFQQQQLQQQQLPQLPPEQLQQIQQEQLPADQQALFNQANIQQLELFNQAQPQQQLPPEQLRQKRLQELQQRPEQLGDLMGRGPGQLGRLMPPPTVNPLSSGVRGDGMSANDLQRMLSRQTIAPENVADTEADILGLQQAEVANRARRANNPIIPGSPIRPDIPFGTPGGGPGSPISPFGPGGGPGSPIGPGGGPGEKGTMPITPGSPFGPGGPLSGFGGFPTNPFSTMPELGGGPSGELGGGPGGPLFFTDGSPSDANNVGDLYNSGFSQPSAIGLGIGGFKQLYQQKNTGSLGSNEISGTNYQQQNTGSLGSNKPTANVLF